MRPMFTPEELEEMRRADEEIEAGLYVTNEEMAASRERDRRHAFNQKDNAAQKVAEAQRRYYEANREKVAEAKRQALKAFRNGLGITQKAFADVLGVAQGTISQWESGGMDYCVERIQAEYPQFEYKGGN